MDSSYAVRMLVAILFGGFWSCAAAPQQPAQVAAAPVTPVTPIPPPTPVRPVTDTHHGTQVEDPYRWLEDWSDPAVQAWSEAQNAHARRYLDALPGREAIDARLSELIRAAGVSFSAPAWRPGRLFVLKMDPPKQQAMLVVMGSPDEAAAAQVVVDPNALDASGATTIDWYVPSPDGRLVAVSLSRHGSEVGDLHIFETATGKDLGDVVPRVNGGTAGGDVAWLAGGDELLYTRYPRQGERPPEDLDFYQQVYRHRVGTPTAEDVYEIGRDFPKIAEIMLQSDGPFERVLLVVQDGDSGRFAHYLRGRDGRWQQLTRFDDEIVQVVFGEKDALYLVSQKGAPRRKLLRMSASRPSLAEARVVVPEGRDVIAARFTRYPAVVPTPGALYLLYQSGGPSTIRAFDHRGRAKPGPAVLPVSSAGQVIALAGDEILFRNESFVEPAAFYRYRPQEGATVKTSLVRQTAVDFSDVEVSREMATSRDGTQVPVNILARKGTPRDGNNPTLLEGYGGYGISMVPAFDPSLLVWLEKGGVYALANLRGGGEYGKEWHEQGRLTTKQNVFDDFIAAMEHLVARKYTRPERLAIEGASNGGLLMGAVFTQRPELCRAVVSAVGVYDMLRAENSPNGVFNIPEFGTVKDPAQFAALYAYSPYHHVKPGTAYPAILMMTGANDPRVDPMHSRKMTARLQAATASEEPVLLRTSAATGHGIGSPLDEIIAEETDEYAFLFYELGVEY